MRAAGTMRVAGLFVLLLVLAGAGCGRGQNAAPAPTLPPPHVTLGSPSPVSTSEGYQVTPASEPVNAAPIPVAAPGAAADAGAAPQNAAVVDAGAAAAPGPTPPEATTPKEDPHQPHGLPPTPSVMKNDAGVGAAPSLGDASVPRAPLQPLGGDEPGP